MRAQHESFCTSWGSRILDVAILECKINHFLLFKSSKATQISSVAAVAMSDLNGILFIRFED